MTDNGPFIGGIIINNLVREIYIYPPRSIIEIQQVVISLRKKKSEPIQPALHGDIHFGQAPNPAKTMHVRFVIEH